MKLLLTSSGIANPSIHDALVDLLGKPIAESSALFVPTGSTPLPRRWREGVGGDPRGSEEPPVRTRLEVVGSVGTHRASQHPTRQLGSDSPRD
jgi:hypothetical protein